MDLNQFKQNDGTMIIPKELVPFVRLTEIPMQRQCLNCGEFFYPEHGHQKFCSPPQGVKRSRCCNAYNAKMNRKRNKLKQEMGK